jgi:hypothetical protein
LKRSVQRSCAECGGYIRASNRTGYCHKNPECRKEYHQIGDYDYKAGHRKKVLCFSCKKSLVYNTTVGICQKNDECKEKYDIVYESVYREMYGLYFVDRKNMWLEQGKVCYLCWEPLLFEESRVDHDHAHKTCNGKGCRDCVRGLTHDFCNILIGYANDDEQKIHLIADNLQRVSKEIRHSWEDYNE